MKNISKGRKREGVREREREKKDVKFSLFHMQFLSGVWSMLSER